MRTKRITLGVTGLSELESLLQQYEDSTKQTRQTLVEELTTTGEALVAEYSPIEDHELKSSTTSTVTHGGTSSFGTIYQTAPHAPFVEFGTGYVGEQHSHPQASEYDWTYDTNAHGTAGWYYYDSDRGSVRFTKGQVASQQHLKASQDLREVTGKVARDIFNRGIKG
jgi:hypothetical protein